MSLTTVKMGSSCKIIKLNTSGKLLQKLLDMGFIPGARVEVIREAPLYDPLELKIHNYYIALRKDEAKNIEVEL